MPDAVGFEHFYRENLARVVRACALVTLDRAVAEDVAAEAFSRLWARWGQISGDDHAGGFVFKTAMRLCRRRGNHNALVFPPEADGDELARAALRRDLLTALRVLSVGQRQAVVLRDWAGFDTKEVAQMLRVAEPTVRVQLHRGRARLRELLDSSAENGARMNGDDTRDDALGRLLDEAVKGVQPDPGRLLSKIHHRGAARRAGRWAVILTSLSLFIAIVGWGALALRAGRTTAGSRLPVASNATQTPTPTVNSSSSSPSAGPATPTMTLQPDNGPVGTRVELSGSGFTGFWRSYGPSSGYGISLQSQVGSCDAIASTVSDFSINQSGELVGWFVVPSEATCFQQALAGKKPVARDMDRNPRVPLV